MKPDKHKQKKHNEYKRKHGIQSKTDKNDSNTESAGPGICKKGQAPIIKSDIKANLEISKHEPSKDKPEQFYYEADSEIVEDTEEQELGEELNDILRDTASTLFQYQYHQSTYFDEIGKYSNLGDKYSDVVSICPNSLTKILLSIPLYERLNIEGNIFEPEDIFNMQMNAEKHFQMMSEVSSKNPLKKMDHQDVEVTFNATPAVITKKVKGRKLECDSMVMECSPIATGVTANIQHDHNIAPPTNNASNDGTIISSLVKENFGPKLKTNREKKPNIKELEDELEMLLNL